MPRSSGSWHGWPAAEKRRLRDRLRTRSSGAAAPETFRQFVERANPRFVWYRHCEALGSVLQRVADGEIRRLMVFEPRRHGKSELVSRLFSAYYLARFPHRWVGLCSYGAELAYTLSRSARENYRRGGGLLARDATAVKHWETASRGGLWAAGVGGPITGLGWHLGIIDDPHKNAEEAASSVVRESVREWYRSTFYSGEETDESRNPDGALVVIQTRWHEDDLCGWLLRSESDEDETPEGWHIVCLPAIAGEALEFPGSCTVEPDWRRAGEALCPERRPVEKLDRVRGRIGPYYWNAIYQQNPQPREGSFFRLAWFPIHGAAPAAARRVRYWDKAGSGSADADYCVGVLMAEAGGVYWIEDVVRGQWSPHERNRVIRQTAALDQQRYGQDVYRARTAAERTGLLAEDSQVLERRGAPVEIWIEQEPGSGVETTAILVQQLAGFWVHAEPVRGEKTVRARGLADQAEAGNVRLVAGSWNRALLDELAGFPAGRHDDQVDAASGAFNKLALGSELQWFF